MIRKIIAVALWLYAAMRVLLDLAGNVDFIITRSEDPAWLARVAHYVINPPPLFLLGVIALGFAILFLPPLRTWIQQKPAQPSQSPAPQLNAHSYDTPMWKAVQHVAISIGEPKDGKCFPRARNDIRQATIDGHLKIWGRKQLTDRERTYSEVITEVPIAYWHISKIGPIATTDHPYEAMYLNQAHTQPEGRGWGPKGFEEKNAYSDLYVNWAQILRLWPIISANLRIDDPEIDRIRRDVGALAESLTSYESFSAQRDDVIARYQRIKTSDHTIWNKDPLRQLRRDFLNRCGITISCEKHFSSVEEDKETRREINNFARQFEECLSSV